MSDRYVYVYEDIYGTPFYVGVGKGDRINDHVRRAKSLLRQSPHSAKARYVMDCIERGFPPSRYKLAEGLTVEQARAIETDVIRQLGRMDLGTGPLLNACDGGHGVRNISAATRALISARTKEAMASQEFRRRLSDSAKAKFERPGVREQLSAGTKRQWQSEDGRAKFAAKAKTRWTPELRAQQAALTRRQNETVGNPNLGKKRSAESRARMSAAHRKRNTSEVEAQA